MDFSAEDHDRLARLDEWRTEVDGRLTDLAVRQRKLPMRVATAVTRAITRKTMITLAAGVLIGQALGAGAGEIVKRIATYLLGHP